MRFWCLLPSCGERETLMVPKLIDSAPTSETRVRVRPVVGVDDMCGPDASPTSAEAWIGRTIGKRHRIVRHVATGGMGHVFLAQHRMLGGSVAVKVLLEGSDEQTTRYFCNEARLLSRLRHPNIVGVFDCGVIGEGSCYIVMEWLSGQDLATFLASEGPLSPRRALWVLTQLASALDYVHGKGIVHRDIKPENVIFHPHANDAVKLFDFGVAVPFLTPPASEEHKVIGTPLYMAPEQAAGDPATPSTDLYALGALALELLTGRAAYERLSASETVSAVLTRPPLLPSDHGIQVEGLDAVFAKAMARDPAERFPSGQAFVRALRQVCTTALVAKSPSHPPRAPEETRVRPSLQPTVSMPATRPPRLSLPPAEAPRRTRSPSGLGVATACCCAVAAWLISV